MPVLRTAEIRRRFLGVLAERGNTVTSRPAGAAQPPIGRIRKGDGTLPRQ